MHCPFVGLYLHIMCNSLYIVYWEIIMVYVAVLICSVIGRYTEKNPWQ
jgi:hypothetical protein